MSREPSHVHPNFPINEFTTGEAWRLFKIMGEFRVPLILFDTDFWGGPVTWIKDRLVAQQLISPQDLDLFHVWTNRKPLLRL